MLTRRHCLLAAAALGVAAGPDLSAIPADDRLQFHILREGSVIGSHTLTFTRRPNGLDIAIAVRIAVGLGPITLFHYRLDGIEQWRDGRIAGLSARANDNGTWETVHAARNSQGLWVSGNEIRRYLAPPDALPATHWNESELRGPWINPQNGRLLHPKITPLGPGPVSADATHDIVADRFDVSGDIRLQIWYTNAHRWVGLAFPAHDGSLVHYEQA